MKENKQTALDMACGYIALKEIDGEKTVKECRVLAMEYKAFFEERCDILDGWDVMKKIYKNIARLRESTESEAWDPCADSNTLDIKAQSYLDIEGHFLVAFEEAGIEV